MLCMLGLVSIRCIMVFLLCDEMLRCSEYYIHIHTYDLKYMAVPQNFFFCRLIFRNTRRPKAGTVGVANLTWRALECRRAYSTHTGSSLLSREHSRKRRRETLGSFKTKLSRGREMRPREMPAPTCSRRGFPLSCSRPRRPRNAKAGPLCVCVEVNVIGKKKSKSKLTQRHAK